MEYECITFRIAFCELLVRTGLGFLDLVAAGDILKVSTIGNVVCLAGAIPTNPMAITNLRTYLTSSLNVRTSVLYGVRNND